MASTRSNRMSHLPTSTAPTMTSYWKPSFALSNNPTGSLFHLSSKTESFPAVKSQRQAVKWSFHATRKTDLTVKFGTSSSITFENVLPNLGDAYDPVMGTFIIPQSGVYLLTLGKLPFQTKVRIGNFKLYF